MPLTRLATDAFGVVTISLVCLTAILGLLCIYRSVFFQIRIRRSFPQLRYFNGPWVTRIILILVAVWWGLGEIVRLSFLKGSGRLISSEAWQKNVCKIYVLSNLGFAEPSMFLMLAFLLHAALQNRESGTLSLRWNRRTISYVLIYCLPMFVLQCALIFIGPKLNHGEISSKRSKLAKFFTSYFSQTNDSSICTYPLLSTICLGVFYTLLISYVSYIGTRMLSLVINKGLRRRVYLLVFSVIFFLPLRVLLLGFSVLPRPGSLACEAIVFLAFLMLLFCTMVGICMLVFFPVADSLALRDIGHIEIEEMPYDDYYYDGASLIANQSFQETERNSDASTKRGSISFRTIVKEESPASQGIGETSFFSHGPLRIVSQNRSQPPISEPMVLLG